MINQISSQIQSLQSIEVKGDVGGDICRVVEIKIPVQYSNTDYC